ncbi:MAG: CoA transferase [Dehalococcoidia bacterium]
MENALSGIKVLDLTHHIAGPYCTKLLAAFGAEVLKVERPGGGDISRRMGPFPNDEPHVEKSAFFLYLNTDKKSITLNLKAATGKEIIKELVKDVDVLVENFAPRVMPSLGLDYQTLEKINPRLVMASISNFGQTGPYRDYKANDMMEYALSGHMYINGHPKREPLNGIEHQPEYQGGLHAFSAIMAALFWREESGEGQCIDISIQECLGQEHEYTLVNYTHRGQIQERLGNRFEIEHPLTIYPCKDGHISMSGNFALKQEPLYLLVDRLDLLDDPRFQSARERFENADEFDAEVGPWFLERTREEIFHSAQELRVLCGPVLNLGEALEDVHYNERGFWQDIDHPTAGKLTYPGAPFVMEETPWQASRAPLLGEHNEETYCGWLGRHKEDLVRMRQAGII